MLRRATIEQLIPILKKDLKRALSMSVPGFPKPYYCAFLLRDVHSFNTWASSGSTYKNNSDRSRTVNCDLRVGSYLYDQISDGGIREEEEELESVNHVSVPIDEKHYDGLRMSLWRLLEAKFREALADYNHKESRRISTVDPNDGLKSFVRGKRANIKRLTKMDVYDQDYWTKFCKRVSLWISELPGLSSSWVDFDVVQETKIFISTEGTVQAQNHQMFSLSANLKKLAKDGSHLEQELVINCGTVGELPDMGRLKELISAKHEILQKQAKAKRVHSFSGPVLLHPGPAGLLFHEAIGHRLEGSRLLASGEGQTFKDQVGKQILSVPLTVRDDPTLRAYEDTKCIGSYYYDDEGTKAQNTTLIEEGVLKGFLNTRAPLTKTKYQSNGHARTAAQQKPMSRMAVTIVEGKEGIPLERLKEKLIKEIRKQKKPYGLIVYDTNGGETETNAYDFQAFSGQIAHATIIYPNGREEFVRGVNFVATPLQALGNIVAYSDSPEVDNGFCGAESGILPITTISPAILVSNLELQSKDEQFVTPNILQRPKSLRRSKNRKKKTRKKRRS